MFHESGDSKLAVCFSKVSTFMSKKYPLSVFHKHVDFIRKVLVFRATFSDFVDKTFLCQVSMHLIHFISIFTIN